MTVPHRKRRQVFNEPGHAHCLTYSTAGRLPLLSYDLACQWVVESIETARRRREFDIYAYIIMPEHVHLLVRPRTSDYDVSKLLYDLKRPVSYKAKQYLLKKGDKARLQKLTVRRSGKEVFRFWLPGGGFDRNVIHQDTLKKIADYLHGNPVRRGLVDDPLDWEWSSARFYAGIRDVPLRMDAWPA